VPSGLGEIIGLLLKPLALLVRWLICVTGFSNEPVLRISELHNQLEPEEIDAASIIVENVGHLRASATRTAHNIRVRCRVDKDGPLDFFWEGIPPTLATDLLEDEPVIRSLQALLFMRAIHANRVSMSPRAFVAPKSSR